MMIGGKNGKKQVMQMNAGKPMMKKKAMVNDHDADDVKMKKNKFMATHGAGGKNLNAPKKAPNMKTGTMKMKRKPKLGSGARFAGVKNNVAEEYEKKGKSPKVAQRIGAAVAAKSGREKYGGGKMSRLAQAGK